VTCQRSGDPAAQPSKGFVQRLRTKTRTEHSLAAARTAFNLSSLIRDNMRRRGLLALIFALSALHLAAFVPSAHAVSPTKVKNRGSQRWSVRVDNVDTSDVSLDPSFEYALHKDLVKELAKTKSFRQVLPSDDRNAREVPDLLILKTTVQEDAPGSDTRGGALDDSGLLGEVAGVFLRLCGWSATSGATKLNARAQLYTREGQIVLDKVIEGEVRFTGDNSRATHNLAHNVAAALKRSPLPDADVVVAEQEAASMSK
jgi:hypothetical protein